jgi:hypothetical protein
MPRSKLQPPRRRPPTLPPAPLTVAEVLTWADAHRDRVGRWPNAYTGSIPEAPLGTSWRQVDNGLRYGSRGLPGNSSLAQLLVEHRGHRHVGALPRLTVAAILRWADAWYQRAGEWPVRESGVIPEATAGDTWKDIDNALIHGLRGFQRGQSLPQLLARRRGVRNLHTIPRLTIKMILRWIEVHHRATGRWPTVHAGPVVGQPGETWLAVQSALDQGTRGLPGGSSLAQLLQEHRGIRNKSRLPRLTERRILAWADAHLRSTGRYTVIASGPIADAPGETWLAMQMALVEGLRGLPGGSSLARLLNERRGVPIHKGRPRRNIGP